MPLETRERVLGFSAAGALVESDFDDPVAIVVGQGEKVTIKWGALDCIGGADEVVYLRDAAGNLLWLWYAPFPGHLGENLYPGIELLEGTYALTFANPGGAGECSAGLLTIREGVVYS